MIDQGGRNEHAQHPLPQPDGAHRERHQQRRRRQRRPELSDYWATVNQFVVDNGHDAIGVNEIRIKPGTKLIGINSTLLATSAELPGLAAPGGPRHRNLSRRRGQLPALIEAVKAAILNDRPAALEKRGNDLKKAFEDARERTKAAAGGGLGCYPISTARLSMEIYAQIKDLDFALAAELLQRQRLAEPAGGAWKSITAGWSVSGGAGVGYGAPVGGGQRARQSRHRRAVLGQHPGRRTVSCTPRRAVDGGTHKIPILTVMHNNAATTRKSCTSSASPTGATASPRSAAIAPRSAPQSRTRTSMQRSRSMG